VRGIAGIIRFDSPPAPPGEIERLIRHMAVCPVDRLGQWTAGPAALAHLLRETTAEDRWENQPLHSAAGEAVLVTDILLENRDELIEELQWTHAEAHLQPDSALVLAAWQRWGTDCPQHLESSHAATAIWRPDRRELFCFSSHSGGSFYYAYRPGFFAFATTLRGLFALPEVSRDLDESALADHLARIPLPPGHTLYRSIRSLPPRTSLLVSADRIVPHGYWAPTEQPEELQLGSDAAYVEAYRHEFRAAVRRKLRARRQIGCLLSGGLDSSAVAAFAGEMLAAEGRRLQAFHTLPAGASDYRWMHRELDESRFARSLQQHAPHIDFHFIPADTEPLPLEAWTDFFAVHCIPPPSLPIASNPAMVRALIEQNVDRLLAGFGGNLVVTMESVPWNYLGHLARERRWAALAREAWGAHRVYGWPPRYLWRQAFAPPSAPRNAALDLLAPDFRRRTGIDERARAFSAQTATSLGLRQRLTRHFAGPMRHGRGNPGAAIERTGIVLQESPLSDRRLNEFCLRLPFAQQIRDGWDRRLVRLATADLLPPDIRWRVTRGFPQPAFQFRFAKLIDSLGGQDRAWDSLALSGDYLDLKQLRALGKSYSGRRDWWPELSLVRALALEHFLVWRATA
jgi:asparagine synthase (glutamine-hydrolysing)